jgi:tetrahydromethanopterin S-methyltransferase subunit G
MKKSLLLVFILAFCYLLADDSKLPRSGSDEKFTPAQDSAYLEALKLKLPLDVRLRNFLFLSQNNWHLFLEEQRATPLSKIAENINSIPKELLAPTGNEQVQRLEDIERSLSFPGGTGWQRYGLKIPMSLIGGLLGLTEDVSPEINYSIDYVADVEVVVYSVQAVVISTIFKGKQNPGKYTFTWNGRNDSGKKMMYGDYIAEVRIGNTKYIRKRIVIN